MAPVPPSAATLTVLGGPRAGASLVLDDAMDEVLIGSDADCKLLLDLPGVSPVHARLSQDAVGITVYDTRSARGVWVNDDRVDGQAPLGDGDVLWLGPPGDAESVMIQCRLPRDLGLGEAPLDAVVSAEPSVEPAESDFFFEDLGPPAAEPAEPAPAFADLETLVEATPAPEPVPAAVEPEDVFFVDESAPPVTVASGAPFTAEETSLHGAAFLVDEPAPEPVAPRPAAVPAPAPPPQAPVVAAPAPALAPPEPPRCDALRRRLRHHGPRPARLPAGASAFRAGRPSCSWSWCSRASAATSPWASWRSRRSTP
jgi:pSer/pThr/pTyr-binding forkhead associated (FHA) protein